MTSPSFPGALDALANPGPTTETDDTGFELDIVVALLQNCLMAIEAKLGIGTGGPPASAAVLRRTATGTSQWGQVAAGDIVAGAVPTLIATTGVLAAPLATWPVTGIPQIYNSLELRILGRTTASLATETVMLRLNGDTSASYYNETLLGQSTASAAIEGLAQSYANVGTITGATATAGWMGSATVRIHGYSGTTAKSTHTIGHVAWGTSTGQAYTYVKGSAGGGASAAITQIDVLPATGSWAAGSILSLYGLP